MSLAKIYPMDSQPLMQIKKHDVRIPSPILFDRNLDDFALRVYAVLRSIQGIDLYSDGWGYLADQQVLVGQTGRSKSQISKALSILKGKYVRWETGRFERNRSVFSIRFKCYEIANNNYQQPEKRAYKPRIPADTNNDSNSLVETQSFRIETQNSLVETQSSYTETTPYIVNKKPTKSLQKADDEGKSKTFVPSSKQHQQSHFSFDFDTISVFAKQAILIYEMQFSSFDISLTVPQKQAISIAICDEQSLNAWRGIITDYGIQYNPKNPKAWDPTKIPFMLNTVLPERLAKLAMATTNITSGLTYNEMITHCQRTGELMTNYEIVQRDPHDPKKNLWARKLETPKT